MKGCTVHHLACTAQHIGHTGMGQMLTSIHGGFVKYCANQNATPVAGNFSISYKKVNPEVKYYIVTEMQLLNF